MKMLDEIKQMMAAGLILAGTVGAVYYYGKNIMAQFEVTGKALYGGPEYEDKDTQIITPRDYNHKYGPDIYQGRVIESIENNANKFSTGGDDKE